MHPRLRPLELLPVDGGAEGEPVFCFRDPTGIAGRIFLRRPAALLAILCDGTRSIADIAEEFARRTGVGVPDDIVERLVGELDTALLLEGERVAEKQRAVADAYHAAPTRAASLAGGCYPDAGPQLMGYLARFADIDGTADAVTEPVAGLIVPHIDFQRGGATYGRAYAALRDPPPDGIIIFGTDHSPTTAPFSLTRKSYATPLGDVPTDVALVDALAARLGNWVFADELHHRSEHSIEFQAVWLRYVFGERTPPVLPVLCGSLHAAVDAGRSPRDDARVAEFLAAIAGATAGRRMLIIAGADFAHVGPHFGDPAPMDGAEARARVEADDRAALAAAAAGDAEGFFAAVAAVRDRNRVCGLAPVYATLALLGPRRGHLLGYDQCAADGPAASFVSIAAMALV